LIINIFSEGIYDRNRKVVSVFEQPDVMDKLRYLNRWYRDGIVNPDASVLLEPPKQLPFFHGIGWPAAATIWQTNNGVAKYQLEKVFGPSYSTDSIQGSMNSISSNSRYKAEALKLIELVNTDHKMRDMMAFGIEGTNFTYVKPNVVRLLTGVSNPDTAVPAMIRDLNAAGFQKIMTEAQRQVDAFRR
jgi:putative aldouronate transport system substrate-binding protein